MKRKGIANLAAFFLLAGFFCWSIVPTAHALSQANASADVVIGQQNFTSHSSNQGQLGYAGGNTIALANGVWSDGKKLIIADIYNSRVLIYNSMPLANNAAADVVVGQANMNGGENNQDQGFAGGNTLAIPYSVYSDGIRLFVADTANNRVLIYNSIPTANNAAADVVIGQPDMNGDSINQGALGTPSANSLYNPESVWSDGKKLLIADEGNSRVLIYNSIPTANNAAADVVIGQPDFASGLENQGNPFATASTMSGPASVFSHSGKLFVADDQNNRVLIFNTIPTTNNAAADVVVGQPDMNSNDIDQGSSAKANTLDGVISVYSDGSRLFVSDIGNSRVLIFNSIPTSNNASADYVVGQADFQGESVNQGASAGPNTLNIQGSAYFAAGKLIVGDALNSRALIYSLDAATRLRKSKSFSLYGGIKGKLFKSTISFNGRRTDLKKGRIYVYENGTAKKTVRLKKNGSWKLKFKDSERNVSRVFQFRYYDAGGRLAGVSDQFNVYLSASSALGKITPVISGSTFPASGNISKGPAAWRKDPFHWSKP